MAGIPGQRSTKATSIPKEYRKGLLADLDGRVAQVREMKRRCHQLAADLGGLEELSYQRRSLVERFCCLEAWLENQERRMLLSQPVDESKWLMALGTFVSLLTRVGLERKVKTISPLDVLRQEARRAG